MLKRILYAGALIASFCLPAAAFPDRLITFIVPFAADGSTDVVARILAEHMSRTLGQQIVIETAVGAGGTIGTARAAKAAPDGHTVVVGSLGPNVAAVGMYNSLPYDPIKDFEPVIMSVLQPMVVITKKDLPVANFREFVAYLKANGSKLNYGSGGVGAQSHLTCAYLNELVGSKSQHVPYRGSAPSLNALIAGQIDYACNNTTEAVPQIQANTVKPLAIAGDRKVPVLPDVPTAAGIKPDVITLSKSLSGYGLPMALVVLKRELDVWKPGEHNGTFRGNNHAFVTATASIEHYWSTNEFQNDIQAKGRYLEKRLGALVEQFAGVEVKGRGMMIGVRCADPARAASVTKKAYTYGLIIERAGPEDEVIKCMMPLTTSYAELEEGMDILERAMAEEFGAATRKAA